jgi:hypothetical protein
MRRMAASVLVFEAFIALFFGLVAAKLHPSGDWVVALVLGGVCVLLAGMMRFRWAYAAGWALQIGFIAAGFLVTDMFFLGAVFAAIWWAGLHYGAKAEQIKAERVAAYEAAQDAAARETPEPEPAVIPAATSVPNHAGTSTEHPGVGTR